MCRDHTDSSRSNTRLLYRLINSRRKLCPCTGWPGQMIGIIGNAASGQYRQHSVTSCFWVNRQDHTGCSFAQVDAGTAFIKGLTQAIGQCMKGMETTPYKTAETIAADYNGMPVPARFHHTRCWDQG